MRRLATLTVIAAAAGGLIALLSHSGSGAGTTARFDVIFDDARGLVGGQLVKVAGARAGTITNVTLTQGFKARIEATIERRFMPFHQDASCTIRPEGLIAENYLQCDPGTASSPVLEGSSGRPPTVPVTNTTEPVSLLDLFNTFNLPTRERMAVILDELGIGTAGRGQDIRQIVERASPTLMLARQAISILTRQRTQLQTLIDSSATLAAQGASHTGDLQRFLDAAAALSSLTAAHQGPLSEAIARLPGLLGALQPSLNQLDALERNGTPLFEELQAAAPSLGQVASDLGPFAAVAKPAIAKLSSSLHLAIPGIRESTPLLRALLSYSNRSAPSTSLTSKLFKNIQRHGFTEEFLSVPYYIAASLARFDSTSHILPIFLIAPNNGACANYATTPVAGCSAHYGSRPPYKPEHYSGLSSLVDYLVK